MNELFKLMNEKLTENGDKSYRTTGNEYADLIFLTPYLEKHLDEVKIGNSFKDKLMAMYVRDPRYGLGRRDLGRKLMYLADVPAKWITVAGRYDDLWHLPTDENLEYLKEQLIANNELAKKWMPRLSGKYKLSAKALCKIWNMSEKRYRALIKAENTTEYKLSYAEEKNEKTALNDLFKQYLYEHPLVSTIDFEKVPSLAMTKYLHAFSTREDIKDRFNEYINAVKENKAKVNTTTANVVDAYKTSVKGTNEASDVIAKKIVEQETLDVELDAICVLDTSGSMYSSAWSFSGIDFSDTNDIGVKAMAVAHAIATHSSYAKNQLVSFSSRPRLMTIAGNTLKEQYESMYTGDCSNTDLAKVMVLLRQLNKYPEYLIILSDMEFDYGSIHSKDKTMKLFKEMGAETKIIWWNFNNRNKTIPEFDEYGNIYLSGYNIQMLKLLENKFDMTEFVDKVLQDYAKKVSYYNEDMI